MTRCFPRRPVVRWGPRPEPASHWSWLSLMIAGAVLCAAPAVRADDPVEQAGAAPPASAPSEGQKPEGLKPEVIPAMLLLAQGEVSLEQGRGKIRRPGTPLPDQARLELKSGAAALGLLTSTRDPGHQLAVALSGSTIVELDGPAAQVRLRRGNRLALSGSGVLILRRWRIELEGSLLLDDYVAYVSQGRARITRSPEPSSRLSLQGLVLSALSRLVSGPRAAGDGQRGEGGVRLIDAGQAARLELGGGISVSTRPPPDQAHQIWSSLGSPPPWSPAVSAVSAVEVDQAQQLTREQLQTQREAASCGCTESSGSGGPALTSQTSVTPVERNSTVVKVKILGMPRTIK